MDQSLSTIHFAADEVSLEEKLNGLPTSPGVYQYRNNEGVVLYVGKARNIRSRVRSYFQKSRPQEPRISAMISKIHNVEIITTDSEVEALILEANLIKEHKPRYNVNLKDDKTYPYIVITNEPFPRIFVTRRVGHDGSRYFGPFTDVTTMRATLKTIRSVFMIRSCNYALDDEFIKKKKVRVCLDYHIKKCEGPCEGFATADHYNAMINQVASILDGKINSVVSSLELQMKAAAAELRFEDAAALRNRIKQLEIYSSKQKVVDVQFRNRDILAIAAEGDDACAVIFKIREGKILGRRHFYLSRVEDKTEGEMIEATVSRFYTEQEEIPPELLLPVLTENSETIKAWLSSKSGKPVCISLPSDDESIEIMRMTKKNAFYLLEEIKIQKMKRDDFVPHGVRSLQKDLQLPGLPKRIECFDISHIQGSETVASMVVFENGKPRKSEYRKYRIRLLEHPGAIDDFASMKEVIRRRYSATDESQMPQPDLIVVDGGKGQLTGAVQVLNQLGLNAQPIISLAKRLEEVFLPGNPESLMIPKASSALRLLQQIRDEAHRFAVSYHRTLRKKRTLRTELDLIKGVGKKRGQELLEAFGSVQGVKFATESQIAEIVGQQVAARILEYFQTEQNPSDQQ